MTEYDRIKKYYGNRKEGNLYSLVRPEVSLEYISRLGHLHHCLFDDFGLDFKNLSVLDYGSGFGDSILDFIRCGFDPENIYALEIDDDRVSIIKSRVSNSVNIVHGDYLSVDPGSKFDVIYVSLVYSSILDDIYSCSLSDYFSKCLSPTGRIYIYDFSYSNPNNLNVRGITTNDIRRYFPNGRIDVSSLTIAPPLSRFLSRYSRKVLRCFAALPFVRTHKFWRISFNNK